MFNLGLLRISEKTLEKYGLKFISERVEEYKNDADLALKNLGNLHGEREYVRCTIFDQEKYINGEFILYIETRGGGNPSTSVITAQEYIERELRQYRFDFSIQDIEFLRSVVERSLEEESRFDKGRYEHILRRFKELEQKGQCVRY